MPVINNKEDWWNCVDRYWDALVEITAHHMDMLHPAYETPGDDKTCPTGRSICDEMEHLRETRNPRLASYFEASWGLASDSYAREGRYGWGALCDLCSEKYVLHEEEEPKIFSPERVD
jgi:hypothetical protein